MHSYLKKPKERQFLSIRSVPPQETQVPKRAKSPDKQPSFNSEYSSKVHLFLFLLYSGTSVNIVIPTSYLEIKSAARKALYYYSEGELHMESEPNSLSKFFEIARDSELKKYRQPKYIHFTKESINLYSDEQEIRDALKTCNPEFSLLQKYVPSNTKYSKKTRIIWNKEKGFYFSLVSNKNPLPKTQWYTKESSQKHTSSSYFHNLTDYAYAGRILKTSLSPLNLYPSVLGKQKVAAPTSSIKCSLSHRFSYDRQQSLNNNEFNQKMYLCKQSDQVNSITIPIHIQYLNLESMIKSFMKLIEKWTERVSAAATIDACFDFVEDHKGRWYLIGCKCRNMKLELLLQSISLRKFVRNHTTRTFTEKKIDHFPKNAEEQIQRKLQDFHQRLSSLSVSPSEVTNLSQEVIGKVYEDYAHTLNNSSLSLRNKAKSGVLSPLANLYDETLLEAKDRKKEIDIQRELRKEYEKKGKERIEGFINEVIAGLSSHESFGKYFRSVQKINGLKEFLDSMAQGKPPIIKSVIYHLMRDLGINRSNFQEFLLLVNSALDKIYEDQYRDMILMRIVDFSGMQALFMRTDTEQSAI